MQVTYEFFCDFDGTISVGDVTDNLLEAFAPPRWRDIENRWRIGEIGSMECMRQQVELLRCSKNELDALVDRVAIDPWFPDFVLACQEAAVPVVILSDGIDYVINRVLRNHGVAEIPFYANKLEILGNERYSLSFPHARFDCIALSGTCKCALMRKLRSSSKTSVLVGDGSSDFCAARAAADFVFAKGSLLEHCRELALPHGAYVNFNDIERSVISPQLGDYAMKKRSPRLSYVGQIPNE